MARAEGYVSEVEVGSSGDFDLFDFADYSPIHFQIISSGVRPALPIFPYSHWNSDNDLSPTIV